jgi:acyl-CoA synthetase
VTIAECVARHAAEMPSATAFVSVRNGRHDTITWTGYQFHGESFASTLAAHPRGARVAVQMPDGFTVHGVMLGLELAGVVGVGIGPRAGAREVEHLVAKTGAVDLLTESPEPTEAPVDAARRFGADELWFINSTSGTTGLPKCVMHHQARWFAFHDLAAEAADLTPFDVFMSLLPTPFGFGLWTAHFTPTILGAPCVVLDRFDPAAVCAAIERYRVTVLSAVSTQFIMMLNSPAFDAYDLSSLRVLFTGGEMVPYERALEWEQRSPNCKVLQFYGSNETGALSRTTLADDEDTRLRTAGRVIDAVHPMHVRLLDAETGADVTARGGPGIAACRGALTCLGYYDDPAANAELVTADGWMRTGDLCTIDAAGVLTVSGRTSDIIIRGGKNLSAAVIEQECATMPGVLLAAAVAKPDEVFGERVCVFCALAADAVRFTLDELRAHLDGRGVGKELWPEYLVLVDDDLPRSSGGKVAKSTLRTQARGLRN